MEEPGEHGVHEIRQDEVESVTMELKDPEEPAQQEDLEEGRHITLDIHQPSSLSLPLHDSPSLP